MTKNYISTNLLFELLKSEKKKRKELEEFLKNKLKKAESFSTSVYSLTKILESEKDKSEVILQSFEGFFDRILPFDLKMIQTSLKLEKEFKLEKEESIQLAICLNNSIDKIIGYGENFNSQKLIPFLDLCLKSK
ncbi:MAG: hypothetical protein KDK36_15910 [Leptospiraceae bacterium]|nr:hypothetical protein [Leptospiraceae bacterium]